MQGWRRRRSTPEPPASAHLNRVLPARTQSDLERWPPTGSDPPLERFLKEVHLHGAFKANWRMRTGGQAEAQLQTLGVARNDALA